MKFDRPVNTWGNPRTEKEEGGNPHKEQEGEDPHTEQEGGGIL